MQAFPLVEKDKVKLTKDDHKSGFRLGHQGNYFSTEFRDSYRLDLSGKPNLLEER